jgi:hypothetical protein
MARTWLSVTVELLGGRGEEPWPWPGRIFAVGPSHTFLDLAEAINRAFARWDLAHLSVFTLADGRVIADQETGAELAESTGGPIQWPLDIAVSRVVRTVGPGAEFQFTFDLGDDWTHRCMVGDDKVDPLEVLGVRPDLPTAYWGWGAIPDQHGRQWEDDDGESPTPPRTSQPHPMFLHAWPAQHQVHAVDVRDVRAAVATTDADRFLDAVGGHDIDDMLQQVGAGIPMALARRRHEAEPVALSVINRLSSRGGAGDQVLAEDLLALIRGESLQGRDLPVELDLLSSELEGDPGLSTGGYLDLRTGDVWNDDATDPMVVGEEVAIGVDDEPDSWLRFERIGARAGWRDMAAFAERQRDEGLRLRMDRALEGTGAFRRFRDFVDAEGLADQWVAFSTDRRIGRARQFLADHGIRVTSRSV